MTAGKRSSFAVFVAAAVAVGSAPAPGPAGASAATSRAEPDPEAVARAFFESLKRHDFDGLARLMHPDALRQLVDDVRTILSGADVPRYRPSAALWDRTYYEELFEVADSAAFQRLSPEFVFARLAESFMGWGDDVLAKATFTMLGSAPDAGDPDVVFLRYCIDRKRPERGYEDIPDASCDDFRFEACSDFSDLCCEPMEHPFWIEHEYMILRNLDGEWRVLRAGFAHDALDMVLGLRETCQCDEVQRGPMP